MRLTTWSLLLCLLGAAHARRAEGQSFALQPICKLGIGAPGDACGPHEYLLWRGADAIPVFEPVMASAGIGGDVTLTFRITPAGRVDTATIVITHSTHRAFEHAVRTALPRWHFNHAFRSGSPLADSVALRVRFVLTDCPDTTLISMVQWLSSRWPPELRITRCPEALVPRDEVF